ncbi:MAG TPA: hypothetical protein VHV77_01370, partial [Pirellulales bacterium]|nr:hypothetical protein [Pirellulales bacterium]
RGTTPSAGDVVQDLGNSAPNRNQLVKLTLIGLGPEFNAVHARPFEQSNLGVEFYSAANASQLIESMRKTLQLFQFGVFNLDENDRQIGAWTPLNQVLRLDGHPPEQRRRYEVRLAGLPATAKLVCEGGELCELHLVSSSGGAQLATSRFNFDGEFLRGLSEQSNVPNPHADAKHPEQSPAQFYVVARRPAINTDKDGATVTFSLSMQNQAADLFSPRPAEAWIEIVPMVERRTGETQAVEGRRYAFYDLAFENLRPAPVLDLHASRWPAQANAADIQIWFKMPGYETKASFVRTVGELLRPGKDEPVEINAARGSKIGIHVEVEPAAGGGTQVIVEERRDGDVGSPRDFKIAVLDRRLRTADVIRHTSAEGRLIQHTFEFRNASEADVRDYELRVTPAEEMKREAVTLRDRPLRVRIPER